MSLDPPSYFTSISNNIRARPIPWEGAVRAGTITDKDLKRIKAVDKVRPEQRRKVVEADFPAYRSLLLGGDGDKSVLEAASRRADVVQYILVLTSDLLKCVPDLSSELLKHSDPYKPFLPLLTYSNNPEEPIPLLASAVLSAQIAAAQSSSESTNLNSKTTETLPKLFTYLAGLTKSHDSGLQDIAVQQYSTIIRSSNARRSFWKQRDETLGPLVDILRTAVGASREDGSTLWSAAGSIRGSDAGLQGGVGIQLFYHVLLVIWQLTYEGTTIGNEFQKEQEIVPLLTHLLRVSPKEKTTRLILSSILNLINPNKSALLPVTISVRLPTLLQTLKGRHLTDDDLIEDLTTLTDILTDYTSSQTTFDEYSSEVLAGHLRWSPPHKNQQFWTENASKILSENKAELPKKLSEILSKPWDDDKQVLAIACNDVGWLVKQCPEKRDQLEKLGIKAKVMTLMADPDESVRWESLRAVGEWLRYNFEG